MVKKTLRKALKRLMKHKEKLRKGYGNVKKSLEKVNKH